MDAREQLKALIEKYIQYKKEKKTEELSEEPTRSWINKFLEIFDWDILNIQQVQQEKIVDNSQKYKLDEINSSHTKPDYSLMNGATVKAYLDAKKTDVDIFKNKDAAFQVRSYGWSAGLPCSFLTNFEQLVIFDCRYAPQKGEDASVAATQISIDNYISRFDELNNHFNRILVYENNLLKLYSSEKVEGSKTLDFIFNKLLSDFRLQLANELYVNNSNLIVFNVKALSEMDENVYNAQLFNILSLMWSEVCKNVAHNNNLVNLLDRRRVICLIDEAHRFINTKNTLCTDFILKLERRSRKYDAGLWYATQSILDFMPSDTGESVDTVKKIFQLVQYKFLLKQSSDSIEILHNIFGQFTMSELYATDNFEAGEMLLSLGSGKNKIHCKNAATECDLMYIGNSQDRDEIVDSIFNRMYLLNWSPQNLADEMYRSEQKTQEFIETFTREVIEYFGFKLTDSEYLYLTVNRLVKNLAKRFGDKYNVRKW